MSGRTPGDRSRAVAALVASLVCLAIMTQTSPAIAGNPVPDEPETNNETLEDTAPLKQARYRGNPILVHLPTGKARALVMPEPVMLKGDADQLPEVEIAYTRNVIGFFAKSTFTRRVVPFLGLESGTEYLLGIRASEYGIVSPLQLLR